MTIEYDYFGDPPVLYARWIGDIQGHELLSTQALILSDKLIRRTACDLYDMTEVTSLDVSPELLRHAAMRWEARRPEPNWGVIRVFLVPDPKFLGFARAYQKALTDQTPDNVQIVSEPAAALALIGRPEATLEDFFASVGPPLAKGD